MIEMFKTMKGTDKISTDELFSRVDSERTRGHSLRVNKRSVKMVVRQGSFTQRVVNAWCFPYDPPDYYWMGRHRQPFRWITCPETAWETAVSC